MADEKDKATPKGAATDSAPRASTRTAPADETSGSAKAKAADAQGSGDGGDGGGAKSQGGGQRQPLKGAELDRARLAVGVTDNAADEYAKLGINPKLDNRLGDQRPFDTGQVKPQQIDGPEVGHYAEHAEQFRAEFEEAIAPPQGDPIGARSEGPHGRGPHGVTVGDEHGQPQEQMATGTDDSDPRNPA